MNREIMEMEKRGEKEFFQPHVSTKQIFLHIF